MYHNNPYTLRLNTNFIMEFMNKTAMLSILVVSGVLIFSGGVALGMHHIDYTDPDWECKKVVGMWELSMQEYPNFVNETAWLVEKKCGFDVNELAS